MSKSKTRHQGEHGTGQVIILILILLVLSSSFYFQDSILSIYNNFRESLQKFVPMIISSRILDEIGKKTDLSNIINEVKKEILTSTPLNIGGKENQAVLTKAKIIAQTNIQRYNNDLLSPLFENAKLNASAKAKADDMFLNQYFEHISPLGVDPGALVKSYGYEYIVAGENLILGNFADEKELVQAWMASPGHRANILNNRFTEIGAAIIKGTYNGKTAWIGVQEFGLPLSACSQPDVGLKTEISDNKIQLDQLSL